MKDMKGDIVEYRIKTNELKQLMLESFLMEAYQDCSKHRAKYALKPISKGDINSFDCVHECSAILDCPLNSAFMEQQGIKAGHC